MKLKKYSYILVFILMLLLGTNNVHAGSKTCYYMTDDGNYKIQLKLMWGYDEDFWELRGLDDYARLSVDKVGEMQWTNNLEAVVNWWAGTVEDPNLYDMCIKDGSVCFDTYYESETKANHASNPACPKYLVFQSCSTYYVWATESESKAAKAVSASKKSGCNAAYVANKDASGNVIDKEKYYSEFVAEGLIEFDCDPTKEDCQPTCLEYESIFGDKNNPDSIRYLLNQILQYVRIIIPILVILLGTIDFAKAVLAGKEDNMRKSQADFVKRIAIGVAIFFVPLLVDVIMDLANIVWNGNYISCDF